MRFFYKLLIVALIPLAGILSSFEQKEVSIDCEPSSVNFDSIKSKNVIVLIIDGPRYSETFGDTSYQYIPHLANDLAPQGVLIKRFRNNGPTYTNAGHAAICTGVYQKINNNGEELPKNPGMFQYFLDQKKLDANHAWIIASKGKLNILANSKNKKWKDKCVCSQYCGVEGKGEGYNNDVNNWRETQRILGEHHPELVLINMLEVDVQGHQNNWPAYLKALKKTDQIAYDLWNFIQNDSIYKDNTTLIITNDHGRHLDGHKDGFVNHGDNCEGCRQMYFVGLGPDFKKGLILENMYEQIDIPVTISKMLHFSIPTAEGKVMNCLFK
ncbi:MAG: alkaline phosphatase family protein [Bacteroidota bacterium]